MKKVIEDAQRKIHELFPKCNSIVQANELFEVFEAMRAGLEAREEAHKELQQRSVKNCKGY